jgi:hypothetical protein
MLGGMNESATPSPEIVLAVGDPRRRAVGRAAFATLRAAAAFFLFTVPAKQVKTVYVHAPWLNDPYDTVYSFAMFLVPLAAAFFLLQVSLCLKAEQVPVARVRSILRGCRVGAVIVAATLLSCWISVADGANRSQWTASTTVPLIAALALLTLMLAWAVVALVRVPRFATGGDGDGVVDWLGDAVAVASRESRWFGPLRPAICRLAGWLARTIMPLLRRHPVRGAVLASVIFGAVVGVNQGLREHYYLASTLLTAALLACGMFAFLVTAGSYLGLVRASTPMRGAPRRVVDASVIACVAALIALAFRNSLWWMIGTTAATAGNSQFALLIGAAMTVAFAATLSAESALRTHSRSG